MVVARLVAPLLLLFGGCVLSVPDLPAACNLDGDCFEGETCVAGQCEPKGTSGEGEGGNEGNEDEILNYYRGQSFEMVGHGAAFELSYAWPHLSGASVHPEGRAKRTKAMQWMGDFYAALDGVKFSLPRDVPLLIVRNNNLQRSNRSGRDFGNALGLISFLHNLVMSTS